jgi:hypothetical protein
LNIKYLISSRGFLGVLYPYSARKIFGKRPMALMIRGIHQYKFAAEKIGGDSVLDVGAGFCALKGYLPVGCDYTGIDATQWVCEVGGATFCALADYSGEAKDFVCLFGVLETATNLVGLVNQARPFAKKAFLFSYSLACKEPFKQYTQEDIKAAFGSNCEFSAPIKGEVLVTCYVNV